MTPTVRLIKLDLVRSCQESQHFEQSRSKRNNEPNQQNHQKKKEPTLQTRNELLFHRSMSGLERSKRKKMRLGFVLSVLLCSLGAFYQIYQVLCVYCAYPVDVDTRIQGTQQFEMPTLALCAQWSVNGSLDKTNVTVADALSKTFSSHQVITSCSMLMPNSIRTRCEQFLINMRTGIMFDYKCFLLFEQSELKYDRAALLDDKLLALNISTLEVSDYLGFSLYSKHDFRLFEGSPTFTLWHLRIVSKIVISFSSSMYKYLPKPYQSGCIDYASQYGRSRNQVIEDCVVQKYTNATSTWPLDVISFQGHSLKFGDWATRARSECSRLYVRNECVNVLYHIDLKSWRTGDGRKKTITLDVYTPAGVSFQVTERAQLRLIELFSHVIDLCNLWLGFAMIDVLESFIPSFAVFDLSDGKTNTSSTTTSRSRKTFVQNKNNNSRFVQTDDNGPMGRTLRSEKLLTSNEHSRANDMKMLTYKNHHRHRQFLFGYCGEKPMYLNDEQIKLKRAKIDRISRIISIVICCVGCSYQLFEAICVILSNPFISDIRLIKPTSIDLPLITTCVRLTSSDLVNSTAANLFARSPHANELFESVMMLDTQMEQMQANDYFDIGERLSATKKCFTWFDPELIKRNIGFASNSSSFRYSPEDLKNVYWVSLRLRTSSRDTSIGMSFHVRNTFPIERGHPESVRLNVVNSSVANEKIYWYMLTYDRTKRQLMSGHRQSRCVDYTQIGFASRHAAIESCTQNKFMTAFGLLPMKSFVNRNDSRIDNKFGERLLAESLDMITECRRLHHKSDCYDVQYRARVDQKHLWKSDDRWSIAVDVLAPQSADLVVNEGMRYSWEEIFGTVGGLLSIWINFSALHLVEFLIRCVTCFC